MSAVGHVEGVEDVELPVIDPAYVAAVTPLLRLALKAYFRSEISGMDHVPDGGALVVSNHSGGLMPMDVPILFVAFADHFGASRELYTLAHDMILKAPGMGHVLKHVGFMPATRANAAAALAAGGVTIVFPGGDWDTFRPTLREATIDFGGRTGYVRTALAAGVPIVPVVSHGGQEAQLFLGRFRTPAKLMLMDRLFRTKHLPISLGFPFGFQMGFIPPNLPFPTKIVTRVLEPIDLVEEFGEDPDVGRIDEEVRRRMQVALDELAAARRFPILG